MLRLIIPIGLLGVWLGLLITYLPTATSTGDAWGIVIFVSLLVLFLAVCLGLAAWVFELLGQFGRGWRRWVNGG